MHMLVSAFGRMVRRGGCSASLAQDSAVRHGPIRSGPELKPGFAECDVPPTLQSTCGGRMPLEIAAGDNPQGLKGPSAVVTARGHHACDILPATVTVPASLCQYKARKRESCPQVSESPSVRLGQRFKHSRQFKGSLGFCPAVCQMRGSTCKTPACAPRATLLG
eukprot:1190652-Amphidinium_carterae.1